MLAIAADLVLVGLEPLTSVPEASHSGQSLPPQPGIVGSGLLGAGTAAVIHRMQSAVKVSVNMIIIFV
jgi:hypothetical protein